MTFYLIGLGLNEEGISLEGFEVVKKCQKIYLENYTVDFPYKKERLEKFLGKKIEELNRKKVENEEFVNEAKKKDIALLIYGNALAATTHISLILKCEKEEIPYKVIHSASIFDGIAETGLQLYKFGKTASMPKQEVEFMKYVKENQKIGAHSLILVDIGMSYEEAISRLKKEAEKKKINFKKIIVCSKLGTKENKILYGKIDSLKKQKISQPFCFIITGKLHFLEEEALRRFEK